MNNALRTAGVGLLLASLLPLVAAYADNDAAAIRGGELLAPFKRDLKEALMAGMQQGPDEAIGVCKTDAPAIARRLSVDGVTMGRTSHRLRNPANAAPDWVAPVLQTWLDDDSPPTPQVVTLDDGLLGYVEPIQMQPLCLTCHGASLAPDVAARIESDYPADEAIGFDVGDLRGVFWITFEGEEE